MISMNPPSLLHPRRSAGFLLRNPFRILAAFTDRDRGIRIVFSRITLAINQSITPFNKYLINQIHQYTGPTIYNSKKNIFWINLLLWTIFILFLCIYIIYLKDNVLKFKFESQMLGFALSSKIQLRVSSPSWTLVFQPGPL